MYAMSEDRARPPGPGRGGHELPVLFHLMDVGRPRPAPPEASPPALPISHAFETQPATVTASAELLSVTSDLLPPALTSAASSIDVPPAISAAMAFDANAVTRQAALPLPTSNALLTSVPAEGIPANVAAASISPASEAVLRTDADEVKAESTEAPKSQPTPRRNRKTAASEDWFATHGKYIAVGFVLALIGTVWMARTNRERANTASADTQWKSPLADEPPSSPAITMPAAGSTHSTVLVSADSQVELHPPITTQVAGGGTRDAKSQSKDKLFDFSSPAKADERVAARTDGGTGDASSSSNKNSPAAASATGHVTPGAPSGAPALSPVYPTTSPGTPVPSYPAASTPTSSYPQTAAPPLVGAFPPTAPEASQQSRYSATPQAASGAPSNYQSQYPVAAEVAAPQPSAWPASPNGVSLPGQYQPFDNTARGPRNERTGSGNY